MNKKKRKEKVRVEEVEEEEIVITEGNSKNYVTFNRERKKEEGN